MLSHWLPWKFLVKRAARAYGIIDPIQFLARFRQFAQPSEVQEPIELLRAGIVFHARGLINKAIQHNLDWVWPYWVEKQYDPADISFVPRAFSISHINLTHRNWTAVGHPDLALYPVVDPRGLVTPLHDGWSIDFWLMTRDNALLYPSKHQDTVQNWLLEPGPAVKTTSSWNGILLQSVVSLEIENSLPFAEIKVSAAGAEGGWLVVGLRPYNPEGIQFIDDIRYQDNPPSWLVNSNNQINFSRRPGKILFSNYQEGDVIHQLGRPKDNHHSTCRAGMATSAALFPLGSSNEESVHIQIPLNNDLSGKSTLPLEKKIQPADLAWKNASSQTASLKIPDKKIQFLYDAAIKTLILLSADSVVPGPYTYRRFWFRDACLMLNAVLSAGMVERTFRILDTFPGLQKMTGYFQSQKGEWDSNGQVLWIMDRFQRITGAPLKRDWMKAVHKGARWINRKRVSKKHGSPHAGLLPAGFSAEHLGPNDFYYWDDFWGLAGLHAASRLAGLFDSQKKMQAYKADAQDFEQSIYKSIDSIPGHRSKGGIPASPYRRMDAGAIGSMVADYPLQLTASDDKRILKTTEFLLKNCFQKGAFFQDMIHSGLNAYLTLDIAQTLLRMNDSRCRSLITTVADMASPTGQWPEAVHPLTGGGCMGDGHHGWASAEWVMMIRNLFVREEGNSLILGSGIFPQWISTGSEISFGPTRTPFGPVSVLFRQKNGKWNLKLEADFSKAPASPDRIVIAVPGYEKLTITDPLQKSFTLEESQ